jgi:hypothetical protein
VLITATGLQGEKPLVDRTMQIREVSKVHPDLPAKVISSLTSSV